MPLEENHGFSQSRNNATGVVGGESVLKRSEDAQAAHPSRRRNFRRTAMVAAVLLAIHFTLAVGSKFQKSTTSDELVHLTGGMNHWRNNDYRLHPENGILPQRWAALPAWLMGTRFPQLEGNPYWRLSDVWVVGHQFFYETGDDHFPRLMAGRAMIGLFSVATGWLVFAWSRRLFGDIGALVSVAFFAFCPTFLAHGGLVTSDTCMAFFFLASVGAWWWHLHDGRFRVWLLSAVVLGLAFVAKHSSVLLLPMMVALAAIRALAREPLWLFGRRFEGTAGKFGAAAASGLAHGFVVAAVIWAFFGFRYSAFNPVLPHADSFIRPWSTILAGTGVAGQVIHQAAHWHLLPEGYLYGLAYVIKTAASRAAFLNGEYSVTGWPTFFLWTFLLKSTLPTLLAIPVTTALGVMQKSGQRISRNLWYRASPLLVLLLVYWVFSLTSHLNIGHRHLLPIYPPLFIGFGVLGLAAASSTASFFRPGGHRGGALAIAAAVVLPGWQAVEAARIAPDFLAYFNPIAGGPKDGWRHLVDSSLDWGQDLPGLKRWLATDAETQGKPVYLSYFGTGQPAYYKMFPRRLPFLNNFAFPTVYVPLEAGTYCISATMLQQVYGISGPWTANLENEYQTLREIEPSLAAFSNDPAAREALLKQAPADSWRRALDRFDLLRFARLCQYLRVRGPDASAGYSILIFRLGSREVHDATAGSISEWSTLIEKTIEARAR